MLRFILISISRHYSRLSAEEAMRRGQRLGWLIGRVFRYRRSEARDALRRALPDLEPEEAEQVLDRMYANQCMNGIELLRLYTLGFEEIENRLINKCQDEIDRVNEEATGFLYLLGHFGNWELTSAVPRLIHSNSYVTAKPIWPPALDRFIIEIRSKLRAGVLPAKGSFRACLKALGKGENIAVVLDQNMRRRHGIFVDFFGRLACTTPGLAILASRTNKPIRLVYLLRKDTMYQEMHLGPPLEPPADRSAEAIREATQRYTKVLEDLIRQHPDHWTWFHRRWKTQPDKKQSARLGDAN